MVLPCNQTQETVFFHLEKDDSLVCTQCWCVAPASSGVLQHDRQKRATTVCADTVLKSSMYGHVTSPYYPYDYPENVTCVWVLQSIHGHRLVLQIDYMKITQCTDLSCCDYLQLTDSDAIGSTTTLCGLRTGMEPMYANGDNVTIEFVSDVFAQPGANGFSLSYYQEPVKLTAVQGSIQSPNYGGGIVSLYPNDLQCEWLVEVAADHHIRVEFAALFHIEGEMGRCIDKLRRGSGLEVGLLEYQPMLCGRSVPEMYYSLSNLAWFQFSTDSTDRYEGFALHYTAEKRLFTEPNGTLRSPLYPQQFPTPIYTEYTVQAPLGYAIYLEVELFDVPYCTEDVNGFCDFCSDNGNYLEIKSMAGPVSRHLYKQTGQFISKRYCNGLAPSRYIMSVDNAVKVVFSSGSGMETGQGFVISYTFVSHEVRLREGFPTQVKFAPLGYETLGYIYYELVVPLGHNLLSFDPQFKLGCSQGQYVMFASTMEDIQYGNFQLYCNKDGEIRDEEDLFLWIQPQHKLGTSDWSMMVIISVDYISTELLLSLWPQNTHLTSSAGVLYGMGSGNFWSSYLDLSRGPPSVTMSASPLSCQSIQYRVYESPLCDSDSLALVRSAYNIPHGRDIRLCNTTYSWRSVSGNELSLIWTQSANNTPRNNWVIIAYQADLQLSDCTFSLGLCGWSDVPSTFAPVSWTHASKEMTQIPTAKFLREHFSRMQDMWKDQRISFINYYMHVSMDVGYAGEKARLTSPLMSSDVSRTLSFKYHMHGTTVGHLNVYVWSWATDTLRLVWSRHGPCNTSWVQVRSLPISACSDYNVLFEATIPRGMSSTDSGDIAVDDIFFCDLPAGVKGCNDSLCGNGTCIDVSPSTYNSGEIMECCCHHGYTGQRCDVQIDLCTDGTVTCLHGGTCLPWQSGASLIADLIPAICVCAPGYTGELCEQEVDECSSTPCLNDARCIDEVNGYHCICPAYFSGHNCQLNTDECAVQQPCRNGATCIHLSLHGYRCVCAVGFTGHDCEQEINECSSKPCYHSALCIDLLNDFRCSCSPGYSGKRCELNTNSCVQAITAGLCYNGASCMDTVNGFVCQCEEGWQGIYCDEPINDCLTNPCVNNAICVDRHRGFQCLCKEGFHGERCDLVTDYCIANECVNGLCVPDGHGYRCDCSASFSGEFCDVLIDVCVENPCGDFPCVPLPFSGYYCVCPLGRTGWTCQSVIDYCKGIDPCLNGGECVSMDTGYRCHCPAEYGGRLCEYLVTRCEGNPCVHGLCYPVDDDFGNMCRCDSGWTGIACDIATYNTACERRNPCHEGATCINTFNDLVCACAAGYTGRHCDRSIDECSSRPCLNAGSCVDAVNSFTCTCTADYTGRLCETKIDPCLKLSCLNGNCVIYDGKAECQCFEGYEGPACADDIDHCSSNPCYNAAPCINLRDGYYCQCNPTSPYQGINCDELVNVCEPHFCLNGGTCESFGYTYRCSCPPGTTGQNCAAMSACDGHPCKHGSCTTVGDTGYLCECDAGWTSQNCDSLEDVCADQHCLNGGRCYANSVGTAICLCSSTYSGPRCESRVDACQGRVCQRGRCEVGTEGVLTGLPVCICEEGVGGYNCGIDLVSGVILSQTRISRNVREERLNVTQGRVNAESCHPLGNETNEATKWVIGAITVGLYLIVILSSLVCTFVSLRLNPGPRHTSRHLNEHVTDPLSYYTPYRGFNTDYTPKRPMISPVLRRHRK